MTTYNATIVDRGTANGYNDAQDYDNTVMTAEGADDALISAMGRRWVLNRALGWDGRSASPIDDTDELWEMIGKPYCKAYVAGVAEALAERRGAR